MSEIHPKKCEGRELTKDQLAATGNATFLDEALAVRSTPGALHRAEFDGAYDRAGFLEWGCLVSRHDIAAIWVAFFSRRASDIVADRGC